MKTFVPWLLILLFLGVTLALLSSTEADMPPTTHPQPDRHRFKPPAPGQVAQGERIALMNCAHCHGADDGHLTGHPITDESSSLGRIVSANITNDSVAGIGQWSDTQLIRLLRTGVGPDGQKAHFIMPRYPLMADPDMQALVAFLRSDSYAVQPARYTGPSNKPSLLSRFVLTFFIKRLPNPPQPILLPDTTKPILYGQYLVNSLYTCFACHSADVEKANMLEPTKTKGYLAGGAKLSDADNQPVYSANLTPDPETGIGRYTEAEFRDVMRLGKKRNGQIVRSPMLPYPLLTDREISSIYAYLKSVRPVHQSIP